MLVEFNVCNFLSFKEMQSLRMRRTEDNGKETGSDCAFIYGPNSSGKSNLIKALNFSQSVILDRPTPDYQPYCNLNNECDVESPSYFEYVIEVKGKRYSYGFEINLTERNSCLRSGNNRGYSNAIRNCIKSEWLYDVTNGEEITLIEYENETDTPRKKYETNENGLVLPIKKEYEDIFNWFKERLIIRNSESDLEYTPVPFDYIDYLNRNLPKLDTGISMVVANEFKKQEIPKNLIRKCKRNMSSDCQLIFVNGNSNRRYWLIFGDGIGDSKTFYELRFRHSSDYEARIDEESIGTRKIIQLLTLLSSQKTMDNEGTIIIDEVECSIHALIMAEFVRKFKSGEFKGSQLIFTTHESRLLADDFSSVEDVWFMDTVEEGNDKHSHLYSMKSFEGTLKKYDTMYLDGRFSAIPRFTPIYFEERDE